MSFIRFYAVPPIKQPIQRRLILAGAFGVIFTAAVFLFFFNPGTSILYPPCLFHKLTGFYCPGCGSLRALHQLLHGHFLTALGLNPLMIVLLPFLCYPLISLVMIVIRGKPLPKVFIHPNLIWIIFVIIIIYWILRNIPYYPFTWLAP